MNQEFVLKVQAPTLSGLVPPHEMTPLDRDSIAVRMDEAVIRSSAAFDDTRLLGIVSVGPFEDSFLAASLPRLISQAASLGRGLDLIVGLNNGAKCPTTEHILSLARENRIFSLVTDERLSPENPARVFDRNHPLVSVNLAEISCDQRNRIFFIHQEPGEHAAGKIRMLSDIYTLCIESRARGWVMPAQTLLFDAESSFYGRSIDGKALSGENGLEILFYDLQSSNFDLISPSHEVCSYEIEQTSGLQVPNFRSDVPPMVTFLNRIHGQPGFRFLTGCGILGNSAAILALGKTVIKYPGLRTEDVMQTVLAEYSGLPWGLSENSLCSNRSRVGERAPVGEGQIERWFKGLAAVISHYGIAALKPIIDCQRLAIASFEPSSPEANELRERSRLGAEFDRSVLPQLRTILKTANKNPDRLIGQGIIACW